MKVLLTLAFSVLVAGSAFADECSSKSTGSCTKTQCESLGFTYVEATDNAGKKCVEIGSTQVVTNCVGANDSGKSLTKSATDVAKEKADAASGTAR
jgi:formate-dependent phosphoribosylglycinamide formyltransferase (GAR transformylase)